MERLVVYVSQTDLVCRCCEDRLDRGEMHTNDDLGVRCLACVGLDHLAVLEPGDAALTRRATRESETSALVLQKSRRRGRGRGRFDRIGTLVERDALVRARESCLLDAPMREQRRDRARERREGSDEAFVLAFASHIRVAFPAMPAEVERTIAEHACAAGSKRVGRSARAKAFDEKVILLAVRAYVRHCETSYDALLRGGLRVGLARKVVQPQINAVLARWRG